LVGGSDEAAVRYSRSTALLCSVLAALVLGACGNRAQTALTPTCAVYRALHADAAQDSEAIVYFRDVPRSRYPSEVVGPFERETGAMETTELGGEMFEFPVLEPYEVDVSDLAQQLGTATPVSIRSCFRGAEVAPKFSDWPLWALNLMEGRPPGEMVGRVVIHSFSPVAISADGQRALVYTEYFCGGLCAAGMFTLLEKHDANWLITARSGVWVS
jgi:hypothetical protein